MNWNTAVVAGERLSALLAAIRASGGTIVSCRPDPGCRVTVTWTAPTR